MDTRWMTWLACPLPPFSPFSPVRPFPPHQCPPPTDGRRNAACSVRMGGWVLHGCIVNPAHTPTISKSSPLFHIQSAIPQFRNSAIPQSISSTTIRNNPAPDITHQFIHQSIRSGLKQTTTINESSIPEYAGLVQKVSGRKTDCGISKSQINTSINGHNPGILVSCNPEIPEFRDNCLPSD